MDGTARLAEPADAAHPLVLHALRLELDGGTGTLRVRTELDGSARELALAELDTADGAAPVVRASGVTWTGLRASLADAGARLLSGWSGESFAVGEGLGELDLTVGTGTGSGAMGGGSAEGAEVSGAPAADADADMEATESEGTQAQGPAEEEPAASAPLSAAVAHPALTAGGERQVTGEGFQAGDVALVAIDGDNRYQAVADAEGWVVRAFPVCGTAVEGGHVVELHFVEGKPGEGGVARFGVRAVS
ncbi:hypothetical protein OK074_1713 [Actinobacteria bacterium OK074]|nr:hypothetical protein OK074_1713 [Actinobacteria bacterium OK074]